jgi:hypothetical protein
VSIPPGFDGYDFVTDAGPASPIFDMVCSLPG